jgi:hypothetical protein
VFTARYALSPYIKRIRFVFKGVIWVFKAVPWLRRLLAVLSPRKSVLEPMSDHVRFVVNKVTLGQVFLWGLRFSPVTTIPPMLRTHLRLHAGLTIRTNGRSVAAIQKSNKVSEIGELWIESTFSESLKGQYLYMLRYDDHMNPNFLMEFRVHISECTLRYI